MVKGKPKKTVAQLQQEINKLAKEQKRLTKKNPKEVVKGIVYGSQSLNATGIVRDLVPQSLHQTKPTSITKVVMRFIASESTPNVANIVRFIAFWYKCEVVAGNIVNPTVLQVMELDDSKSTTDYTNRKNIRVIYDTKLKGTLGAEAGGASLNFNFNLPQMRCFERTKNYKDGYKLDAIDNNDLVWHPFFLMVADSYNVGTLGTYSIDYFYYD